jgi:copper chaperone NosL
MKQRMFTGVLLLIAILTVGCSSPEPHPIDYGIAQCVSCLMSVTDTRFGAEAVSTTGKTYVFDSPECMFGWYLAEHDVRSEDIHSLGDRSCASRYADRCKHGTLPA